MSTDVYSFLEHRGVKGMKWGVRRPRASPKAKERAKKVAGTTAVVGATAALILLEKHGATSLSKAVRR